MSRRRAERLRQLEQRLAERPSTPGTPPELDIWLEAVRLYLSETLLERGPPPQEGAAERRRLYEEQLRQIIREKTEQEESREFPEY